MKTERIRFIDTLRGFAIFLVTLGHVLENTGYHKNSLYQLIYSFHMPLFICISGFVIAYSFNNKLAKTNTITIKDTLNYILSKFKAIMLPYYAWSLIAIPFFFYTYNGTLDYNKVLEAVFVNNTSFWFLPLLFGCSIIFILYKYFLYCLPEKLRVKSITKSIVVFFLIVGLFLLLQITKYDFLRSISSYILPFIIGVTIAEYKRIYDAICNNSIVYTASLLIFLFIVGMFINPANPIMEKGSRFICGILSIPICFNFFNRGNILHPRIDNYLNRIGQNTLIIYILQFSFIKQLVAIPGLNILLQLCIFSIIVVLIIELILLIQKIFEQNRILRIILLGKK